MPELVVETVALSTLKPDKGNARAHGPRNLDAIKASLTEFGQREPLVVHKSTVIAGNGRLEAMLDLGWTDAAIHRVPDEWTVKQARAYAIASNRTAELATWNPEALLKTLDGLPDDLRLAAGFDPDELADLTSVFTPPNLDELADQFPGDGDGVSALWPLLSVRVPPTVMAAWKAHVDTYGGEAPAALAGLLGLSWEDATT